METVKRRLCGLTIRRVPFLVHIFKKEKVERKEHDGCTTRYKQTTKANLTLPVRLVVQESVTDY